MNGDLKELVTLFIGASGATVSLMLAIAKVIATIQVRREKRRQHEAENEGRTLEQKGEARRWELEAFKEIIEAQRLEITRCVAETDQERKDREADRLRHVAELAANQLRFERERAEWATERDRMHKENERLTIQMLEHGMRIKPNEDGEPR